MASKLVVIALILCVSVTPAASVNPVRKVVTMLQKMQAKVSEEGEQEEKLYDKFMCYCKNSGGDLTDSIAAAEAKVPELTSSIEESENKLAQLKEDITQHKADREAAEKAMKEATAIREKEAAAFAKDKARSEAEMSSVSAAVAALEKGTAGAFLQSGAAQIVQKLAQASEELEDEDRQQLIAFLSARNSNEYSPQSGQIVGILKQIGDEMSKAYNDMVADEEAAIQEYDELMKAKKMEVVALTKSIETKMQRVGDLAMSIAEMKNELDDTAAGLEEDKKFLASLEKGCDTKKAEYEERTKTRAEELVALADTIKVLNDDDALELFKKTLPSGSASFLQVQVSTEDMRSSAVSVMRDIQSKHLPRREQIDFILLALNGKKVGFEEVIKMIDEMAATLAEEQKDDDEKKDKCSDDFDMADDKKKSLEHDLSDLETSMNEAEEKIGAFKADIESLQASIAKLDKSVAEATANRKAEHEEFEALLASDTAAKELLNFAKNRLNKFYNPKLYKAPPKRELSDADRAVLAGGGELDTTPPPGGIAGTGITVLADVSEHDQQEAAPPPPPETWGAYKKSGESTGVIAMIDLLVKDLDKELTVATAEEKNAQADYETFMEDSAQRRAAESKSLAQQQGALAEGEATFEDFKASDAATKKELAATNKFIAALHADCDWLLKYFDTRKEARASEIDSLQKAQAVLSGADYSFVQTKAVRGHLRG